MQKPEFDKKWQKRFEQFALKETEAGIAGWSESGLAARVQFFMQHVKIAPGLWMDIGCGAGTYSRLMIEQGASVVGIDYSFVSLSKAKATKPSLSYFCADAYHLPFKADIASGCLSFGVLQAIDNERPFLQELHSHLQVGGEIWIDGLNKFCLLHLIKNMKRKWLKKSRHLRYTSAWEIKQSLMTNGFEQVEIFWAPIMPGYFSFLNQFLMNKKLQNIYKACWPLMALLSHSYYLHAYKRAPVRPVL